MRVVQFRKPLITFMLVVTVASQAMTSAWAFDHRQVCDAISQGQLVRLFYRPGETERMVEPRYLYYTKNRDVVLSGWQVSGFSESGNLPGARSFRLDRTQKIVFTREATSSGASTTGRLPSGAAELICRK